ncbi:MAG: MMPL family transporter [Pontibacterium sp.]
MVERILTFSARHRLVALFALILLTCVAAGGLMQLKIDTSYDSLVSQEDAGWPVYKQTIKEFGSDNTTIIYVKDDDLWNPDTLFELENLVFALEELEKVETIDSVFHTTNIRDRDGILDSAPLMDYAPVDQEESDRIREDALYNQLVNGNLLSKDGNSLAINLTIAKDRADPTYNQVFYDEVNAVLEEFGGGFDQIFQVGPPRLNIEIERGMFNDLSILSPISTLILVGSIIFFLKTFSAAAIPMATATVSILWTFGFMGYFGIPLTLLTAIVPSLVIVIGSTEDTHLLSAYLSGIDKNSPELRRKAIRFMAKHTGLPVFITGFTTSVGFLSNGISDIPLIRDFAYASSFAMAANLVVTLLTVPLLLTIIGPKETKVAEGEELPKGIMGKITLLFEKASVRHERKVIAITLVLFASMAYFSSHVKVSNDPLSYFKSDHQLIGDADTLHDEIAGMQIFYLTLDARLKDAFNQAEYLKAVQGAAEALRASGDFDKVISISDHLSLVNQEMNGADSAMYNVPDTDKQVAEYLLLFQRSDLDSYLSNDGQRANIVVRHNISDSSDLNAVVAQVTPELERVLSPLGIEFSITGENILINNAAESLFSGQIASLVILISIIVFIMTALYSSITVGLISLVPNLIPVVFNFGVMGLFDIPLNPGTATVAAIAVGIAIDDTIHLLTHYGSYSRKYMDPEIAAQKTVRSQAIPVISTSCSLALGFGILFFSDFAIVAQFGVLAGATMIYALFADLLISPIVLKRVRVVSQGDILMLSIDPRVMEQCSLFAGMTKKQIKRFILLGNQSDYAAGEVIMQQGDTSNEMMVVLSGRVDVLLEKEGSEPVKLASLESGALVGEMAFLKGVPRQATVIATEDTVCMVMSPESVERSLKSQPKLSTLMYRNLSELVTDRYVGVMESQMKA